MNFARDNDESLNDSMKIAFQNAFETYDAVTMTIFCGIFHS